MTDYSDFYGSINPRDVPLYGVSEAARIINGMPASTLRSWFCGSGSVLNPAESKPVTLSFNDLVEASVLRALRVHHDIRLEEIRVAIEFAEKSLNVNRLLLHRELYTDGVRLILKHFGEFVHLSPASQLLMKTMLDQQLQRIDWDSDKLAARYYPNIAGYPTEAKYVCIDPLVSFGQATVASKKISTNVIYGRFNAGESIDELKADYGLSEKEVKSAIVFEEAA